ncbi:hypothetical protein [Kallipyga massiliensis]|uniref:hypothetical protein n=1 Tax=Kallipyga massiliensis TaxID=1472764 RepID=UPI0004BC1525|nr:hypothetical protein [Kallipyga massiliensis]
MADDKNSKEVLEQEIDPTQDDSQSNGKSTKDEKTAEKTFTQEEVNAIVAGEKIEVFSPQAKTIPCIMNLYY